MTNVQESADKKFARLGQAYIIFMLGGVAYIALAVAFALTGNESASLVSLSTVVSLWLVGVSMRYEHSALKVIYEVVKSKNTPTGTAS